MISQYTKAVGQLQELFQELAEDGKITDEQAGRFDQAQKTLVNFHAWVKNQLDGNIKVELPWEDPAFVDIWVLWKKFRMQQHGFSYKPISEQKALVRLTELAHGDMKTAIAIVDQSLGKWKDFYELKPQNTITKNLVEPQNLDYKQNLFNRLTQK